jgi:hypothetical protein
VIEARVVPPPIGTSAQIQPDPSPRPSARTNLEMLVVQKRVDFLERMLCSLRWRVNDHMDSRPKEATYPEAFPKSSPLCGVKRKRADDGM